MNKLHYKNPDNLKTTMEQLINFIENPAREGKEEDVDHSPTKAKDQALGELKMPSKYATILTCSFEKDQRSGLDLKMLS